MLMLAMAGIMFSANAQAEKKSDAKLKDHVCTKACTKEKHAYAHGEKGHVCTDACKKKGKA